MPGGSSRKVHDGATTTSSARGPSRHGRWTRSLNTLTVLRHLAGPEAVVPEQLSPRVSSRVGPVLSGDQENSSPVVVKPTPPSRSSSFTRALQNNARELVNRLPTMKKLLGMGSSHKDVFKHASADKPLKRAGSSRRIRRREFNFVVAEPTPEKIRKMRWVLMPRSNWKVRWDLWIGFIICYSVVMVPYRIGFAIDLSPWELYLNYAFDASFATDIVFNFFTGYFDEDVFVYELPKIRARYLKSWFIFDVLSTLPMDQVFQAATMSPTDPSLLSFKLLRTIRLVRLLKLMRLLRLKRAIEALEMDALNAHVLQTAKSLGGIVLVIHLISCAWYMFFTWDPTGINWVTYMDPSGRIDNPYMVCFYWVANTMMSVGYGDIYGITDGERMFSIFVECLGAVSVGLIIANIQMLTENYNPRGIKLKQKLTETKEFLLKRGVPRRLRQRVISQFEYHWSSHTVFDEDELLHNFPTSLQYEILAASMESFVKKFPFFGMTSVDFFVFTIPRLRPIVVAPGMPVVEVESVWEEMYFIVNGSLEGMRGNAVVSSLSGGDICGVEYLVGTRRRYAHSYISTAKTELFAIYTADLIRGMEHCAIATRYLLDLAQIISGRYDDAARRGHKVLRRDSSSRRASVELFLQYRNRTSQSQSLNQAAMAPEGFGDAKRFHLSVTDDIPLHWSIIRHYSRVRLAWDAAMGIIVAWTTISVPFRISFNISDTEFLTFTDRLSDIVFLMDILLNFFTTYLDETGVEIVDRHEIRRHYLKRSFLVDVVSTIPFDFIVELITASGDFRSLKLIRTVKLVKLLRLVRIMKIFKLNSQRLSELDISMSTVRLLKLLAPALTIAHYVGCFWYYLSADVEARHAWWGRIYFDDPDSVISKYIASVYWATTTMATVGFGDVYAVNSNEQLFSIIVMIGGTTLFAYVVGTVIEVVSNSKSLMNREHELGQRVNAYIKERNVSSDFIVACQEHLRFLNSEKTLFNEQGLFDALPHSMRSELILTLNANVLSQIRFFDKKPKWFLTLLLPRLVPQFFLRGDLLIYHGNRVSGIFFLMSGTVVARLPRVQTPGGANNDPHRYSRSPGAVSDAGASGSGSFKSSAPSPLGNVTIATNGHTTNAVPDNDGTIATLHEGEFFGYKEVLTGAFAQYNVFACLPTGTYILPSESLDTIRELYPDVLVEMRRFFLHSITKQQTILQHWHDNAFMGISSTESSDIFGAVDQSSGRRSNLSPSPVSHAIKVVDEGSEAENEAGASTPDSATCADDDGALQPQLDRSSTTRSREALVGVEPQPHAPKDLKPIFEPRRRSQTSGSSDHRANDIQAVPSEMLDDDNLPNGYHRKDSDGSRLSEPDPPVRDVRTQPDLERRGSFKVRVRPTGTISEDNAKALRSSSAVFQGKGRGPQTRVHFRQNSLVLQKILPPPLLRYPSMPEEINALVSKMLEVEGYTRPTMEADNMEVNETQS